MSKEAALRAMREAWYDERTARASASPRPARPSVRPTPARSADTPGRPADAVAPAEPTELLCGHRSMNGRTCTREHGHAAKSHRYS